MMKIYLMTFLFLAVAGMSAAEAVPAAKLRFAPMQTRLEPRPAWWQVRPAEIIQLCRSVTKGQAKVIARTPAGFPVYAVFYGDFSEPAPQTNWSAGGRSGSIGSYCARNPGEPQTFLFLTGIHGAEPESVCAAVNLIRMLETGKDFRGKTDPELLKLIARYRLIIIPCVNMDGRAISPDHLRQADQHTFLAASQGIWKDGSLIGWRGSKAYFPLPLDKVTYPGGYPNSEGFNIMHDACPGHIRTAEAGAVLQLCERYCVDAVLNGHSCRGCPVMLPANILTYPEHIRRSEQLADQVQQALYEAGLRPAPAKVPAHAQSREFNLNTLMTLASGAYTQTVECSTGSQNESDPFPEKFSFDDLAEPNFIALKVMLKDGLRKPFCDRTELLRRKDSAK